MKLIHSNNDQIKIVHVVDYLMPDIGYQEFLLPLENSRDNMDVHLVTSDRYYPIPDYDTKWGPLMGDRILHPSKKKIELLNIYRLKTLFEILARPWLLGLNKKINSLDPDVVFVHGSGSFLIYRVVISNLFNKRLIYVDNHMIEDVVQTGFIQSIYYSLHKFFMKYIIQRRVNRFFGVTEDSSNYLMKYEGIDKKNVNLLTLGVDMNIFDYCRNVDLDANPFTIIQTGKLDNFKSPDLLAQAAVNCLDKNLNIYVKFVGGGPDKMINRIHKIFLEAGYEDKYEVTGFKSSKSLADEFSQAHLSVYPGGTSLSALESAAVGCPVLMNDLPASMEKNAKGVGFIFKNLSVEDLALKIDHAYNNRSFLKNLSKQGYESIVKNFSYKKISSELKNYIFNDIIQ